MLDPYESFDQYYREGGWPGGGSGIGSAPEHNGPYLELLRSFLQYSPDTQSILDIGCGDWRLMQTLDLGDRDYLGIDVSPTVLATTARFTTPRIRFQRCNPVTQQIPRVDLIIVKDVLQHIPTRDIQAILAKVYKSCRWALITNDYAPYNSGDTVVNGYRPLNIQASPFNAPGIEVARYGGSEIGYKRSILVGPIQKSN